MQAVTKNITIRTVQPPIDFENNWTFFIERRLHELYKEGKYIVATKEMSSQRQKFYRNIHKHRELFLFVEEFYPNRGEVLIRKIDGTTLTLNVMLKNQRLNLDLNTCLLSKRHMEVYLRQMREVLNGRVITWQRVFGFNNYTVRLNQLTGQGVLAVGLVDDIDGERVTPVIENGLIVYKPVDENGKYFVAMLRKPIGVAHKGALRDVVGVIATTYEELYHYENENPGFFWTT